MIHNYIRLAWRHLLANKTVSFINIFGLSIAVACCISVFLFLQNYWTLDNFHEHGERIFMVEYVTDTNSEEQVWGNPPAPVAAALATDFPQVEHVVRVQYKGVKVLNKENVYDELLTCVDPSFFDMFTFPLRYGDPAALHDPNAVILSAAMAEKYFGDEMPIGRSILLITSEQKRRQFTVQGVAEPFPNNTSFAFNFLAAHQITSTMQDWQSRTSGIFVQLYNPQDADLLEQQLTRYLAPFNANNPDIKIKSFVLDNLRHPVEKAYNVIQRPAEANHPGLTLIFGFIALSMLALSCFNYINISLGTITRRLKEIGMRKVIGGKRLHLIAQFMAENLLLCFAALAIGLMLAEAVCIPLLNEIMVLKTDLSFSENVGLWFFLLGLLAFTGLLSGLYPAVYISSFRPTAIFAGRQKFSNQTIVRRGLLTAQFALAFLAIIITVVLLTAARQWQTLAWGYNPEQTLVVQLAESEQFDLLKNELVKNASVQQVAGSAHHIGQSYHRESVQIGGQTQSIFCFDVGADYLQVLGLDLQDGRFFDQNRRVEDEDAVIVNRAFAKKQNWHQAIGQQMRSDNKDYTVIGVIADFKFHGTGAANPTVFFRAHEPDFRYLVARFAPGGIEAARAQTERTWQGLFPDMPLNCFLQSDVFDGFYQAFRKVSRSFGYIGGLALIISCMGLYGLALQHFSRRLKEMGVRKLLGAPLAQIMLLVNREFVVLLLFAGGLTTIASFVGIRIFLQTVEEFVGPYRPGMWPFLFANLVVLSTAAIAVGRQSWKVATVNLSEVLKNAD